MHMIMHVRLSTLEVMNADEGQDPFCRRREKPFMPPHDNERRAPVHNTTGVVHGGPVIQTGTIHGSLHLGTDRPGPVPRQLPIPPRIFTDRKPEFHRLNVLHHEIAREGRGRIMVLTGTGGVGKTALATRFLDTITEHFPDGTLYTDLQGFAETEPTDPSETLGSFLRALGVRPDAIPHTLDARAAAFRSHTHGRRIAFLLDNAATAAQVRALIPGQGPHLILVTTRSRLAGLRMDGAAFLDVRPLGEVEAIELVAHMLGDDRTHADPTSARTLVGLCGRLPLALRAAVSGLALRPRQPLSRLVSRLADEGERLATLSRTRESSVEDVFTTSYRQLPEPTRRLYRLLGLLPARDLTVEVASALLAGQEAETEDLLNHLVSANLLEEIPTERFRQHDLIRLHARSRAEGDEPAASAEAALDRMVEYYLTTTAAADRALNPGRWHLAPVYERLPKRRFDSKRQAADWLAAELEALRTIVRFCADTGRHSACWQLCEALLGFFLLRKQLDTWARTCEIGSASARTLDDPAAQAMMLTVLATRHLHAHAPGQATELNTQALELWRRAGHPLGQASALEGLGVCELARGRPTEARAHFESALALHTRLGRNRGIALMLRRLGETNRDLGEHEAAIDYFHRALEFFTEDEETFARIRVLAGLAATRLAAADPERARPSLEDVLRLSERIGAHFEKAGAHAMLADLAESEGRIGQAREQLNAALSTYTGPSCPEAERTRSRLARPPYTDPR